MAELLSVKTKKTEVHDDVVKVLETALAYAKKGELTGIVVVGEYLDGCSYTGYSACLNRHVLISGIEIVKHKIIRSLIEER